MTVETKLPGTNPDFHSFRKYMALITYKGRKIIAHVGSCKQSGCGWSGTYMDNDARDRGTWKHRAEKVQHARADFFKQTITDPIEVNDALLETADQHSHTFEKWGAAIELIWCRYTGLRPRDMPDYAGRVDYHLGVSAREAARKMIAQEYDA